MGRKGTGETPALGARWVDRGRAISALCIHNAMIPPHHLDYSQRHDCPPLFFFPPSFSITSDYLCTLGSVYSLSAFLFFFPHRSVFSRSLT